MSDALQTREREKYEAMWRLPDYRVSSPEAGALDTLRGLLAPGCAVNVYGCGPGRAGLVLALASHRVAMLDIAANCLDENVHAALARTDLSLRFRAGNITEAGRYLPEADFGVCCDVLEHLPEPWVDPALGAMAALTPRVFMTISHVPDVCGRWIGDTLHLTVRPFSWWLPRIAARFAGVTIISQGSTVTSLVAEVPDVRC